MVYDALMSMVGQLLFDTLLDLKCTPRNELLHYVVILFLIF